MEITVKPLPSLALSPAPSIQNHPHLVNGHRRCRNKNACLMSTDPRPLQLGGQNLENIYLITIINQIS